MARLPTVGGDDGNWGTILNEYLEVDHNADGTHKNSSATQKGVVELATAQEVALGTDAERAVTPATLYTTQTLTDAATINWNLSQGAMATVTLGGNRTLAAPTNLVNGATYVLIIKQDSGGNRTLSFNGVFKFPSGVAPVLSSSPNAVDIVSFLCDGTNLYASFVGDFS